MDEQRPQVVVIAGPNGAGKSTSAKVLVPDTMGLYDYVNADDIARGISPYHAESVAFEAGRVMLQRIKQLWSERRDFAFETTLSGRTHVRILERMRTDGYAIHLIFVALNSPELASERVAYRVTLGGHDIPRDVIQRRFPAGIRNLFRWYLPLADTWSLYDNSGRGVPRLVASGTARVEPDILEPEIWKRLRTMGTSR
jgi:predicted ABC-type ATPase